jgi:hypothetical protein
LTLANTADIAQIVIAIATALGVIAAFEATRRTLKEVQRDREARQAPFLSFTPGGWPIAIEFIDSRLAIPGVEPSYVRSVLKDFPGRLSRIDLKEDKNARPFYGRLQNSGVGAALDIEITWVTDQVKVGRDSFTIDDNKRKEPLYDAPLNTMPTLPSLLAPGAVGELTRLPSFIVMDIERKISEASGKLEITCLDVSGRKYETKQEFWLGTGYSENEPNVHVTFGDIVT